MISRILNLNERPLLKRIVHGGIWSVIGEVGTRLFPFITAIIIARLLGVEDFGSFAMIQATAGAFSVIGGFGLGNTATKYVAEYRYTQPDKACKVICLTLFVTALTGLIASFSLFFTSEIVASKVLSKESLSTPLSWASPMLFFSALSGAINGILMGVEKTKIIAKISAITACLTSIYIILGIYNYGVLGGAVAIMLGSITQVVIGGYVLLIELRESGLRIEINNFIQERNLIWSFSLPSTLATLMYIPVVWLVQAIIVNQPDGYEEIGLYNAALKWQTLATFLPLAFSSIYLPVLSSISSKESYKKYLDTTNKLALVSFFSVFPTILVLNYFAESAMLFFGNEFKSGDALLKWVLVMAAITVIYRVYWQALIGLGKVWLTFWVTLASGIFNILFTWHLKSHGALALVYSMSIVSLFALIFYIYYLNFAYKKRA